MLVAVLLYTLLPESLVLNLVTYNFLVSDFITTEASDLLFFATIAQTLCLAFKVEAAPGCVAPSCPPGCADASEARAGTSETLVEMIDVGFSDSD